MGEWSNVDKNGLNIQVGYRWYISDGALYLNLITQDTPYTTHSHATSLQTCSVWHCSLFVYYKSSYLGGFQKTLNCNLSLEL